MLISYGLVRSPLRLTVRTPDFQSDNKSSTLLGGTNYNAAGFSAAFSFFVFLFFVFLFLLLASIFRIVAQQSVFHIFYKSV